jgi:2-dehydropantoate 2-reductase
VRVIVYGAGGVGGVIGARLFQQGHDVTLIARGAHYEAIRDRGLRLHTPEESVELPIPVADRPGAVEFRPDDVVLLAMKTQDTTPALAELAAVAPPDVVIASAQNGVENERLALRLFPRVYGVCVILPAVFIEPGAVEVHLAPLSGRLDLGRYPGGVDDTARSLAEALTAATFVSEARPDIMRYKYGKLLINLGNAVEALVGPGDQGDELARLAREEGEACLRAAGIEAASGVTITSKIQPVSGRERPGGSSTQSLHRGTGTVEADFLNGEIVLLGREHGVATPVNEHLRGLANRMAREKARPGSMSASEVLSSLSGPAAR